VSSLPPEIPSALPVISKHSIFRLPDLPIIFLNSQVQGEYSQHLKTGSLGVVEVPADEPWGRGGYDYGSGGQNHHRGWRVRRRDPG
jgi:hypothetical protein